MTYPVIITAVSIAGVLGLVVIAWLISLRDEPTPAQQLHRTHKPPRVKTTIICENERGHSEHIVGDVPHVPQSALIRHMPGRV